MSVEDALYYDERLAEVAAVGVPDDKLGELVAAVVSTKPAFHGRVKESELLELARSKSVDPVRCAHAILTHIRYRLPYFAVPALIIIQDKPFGRHIIMVMTPTLLKICNRTDTFREDHEGTFEEAGRCRMGGQEEAGTCRAIVIRGWIGI